MTVAGKGDVVARDPSLDRLDVDVQFLREGMMGEALLHHRGSQSLVRHET
jgi:hypothetical protein